MKYLKKFNEMMMLENEIDDFVDSAVAKYQKKIDNCMLHLTDEYKPIDEHNMSYKFYYYFNVPAGEMENFIKCMEESFSALVFEVNATIEINYRLLTKHKNGINYHELTTRDYKTEFYLLKTELLEEYFDKKCTIDITIK